MAIPEASSRARVLHDLAVPPGNRLETLKGDLAGFHSIRINYPWRLIFRRTENGPEKVAIVDSHRRHLVALYVVPVKSPITPGEILLEEYLKPMGISQNAMARAIGVPPRAVNEIVLGKRSITPAMSIRFGVFFGQSDVFWHGLQVECDFRALGRDRKKLTAGITPAKALH